MTLCWKCGRFQGHICFPPIPTCTCDDEEREPDALDDLIAEAVGDATASEVEEGRND